MAIRKNKKRIDPRYLLSETTYRDLDEEEIPPTTSHDDQGRYTGPELDENEVLQKVSALYKAVSPTFNDLQREGPDKIAARAQMWNKRDPKNGLRVMWGDTVGHLYEPMRAMVPIYDAIRQGWRAPSGKNSVDILAHHAGNLAEVFLSLPKDWQQRIQFLQNPEVFEEFITKAQKWGKEGNIK